MNNPTDKARSALLPCPFCGTAPMVEDGAFYEMAYCPQCKFEKRADNWNTRAQAADGVREAVDFAIGSLRYAQMYLPFNLLGTVPAAIVGLERVIAALNAPKSVEG